MSHYVTSSSASFSFFFFFNDTATTEIYTLSLHDALPICATHAGATLPFRRSPPRAGRGRARGIPLRTASERAHSAERKRSEEHTSELQSRPHLVCRLLLEKKKKN